MFFYEKYPHLNAIELSNMYDGPFYSRTLVYPELGTYSEPCQISTMENLFRTMYNPSILRSLA